MTPDAIQVQTTNCIIFGACLIVLCAFFGLFASFNQFLTAGAILVTTVFMYYAFRTIDFWLVRYHEKNDVEVFQRIRNRLLLGFGMVTVFTLPISIAGFEIEELNEIYIYSMLITLISILFVAHFFFQPIRKMCKIKYFPKTNATWYLIAANLIVWIQTIQILINDSDEIAAPKEGELLEKSKILMLRLIPHIVFSTLSSFSISQVLMVWNGEFELLGDAWSILAVESGREIPDYRERRVQELKKRQFRNTDELDRKLNRILGREKPSVTIPKCEGVNCPFFTASLVPNRRTYIRNECKICLIEYSETRIPRILKECGHTICDECVTKLLDKNHRKYVFCPFCQNCTVVNGPASLLAKNYALLDVIHEIK